MLRAADRHDARSCGARLVDARAPLSWPSALPCSAQHILERDVIDREVRHDALELAILLLELPKPLRVRRFHPAVLLLRAAVQVDRARGALRRQDPDEALAIWRALVSGRWSMIDWFDSDDRRYVLALPNPPHVDDPRGLTKRESQVVAYALLGEGHKMIAYRLGLSRPTVSKALRAAMRKLGVKTQAQLVARLRGTPSEES